MEKKKTTFWKKLWIWLQSFKIVQIVTYIKENYAAIESTVKDKSTGSIISYLFNLVKDILEVYKQVQGVEIPTKAGARVPYLAQCKTRIGRTLAAAAKIKTTTSKTKKL